jgi:hypothetical protein
MLAVILVELSLNYGDLTFMPRMQLACVCLPHDTPTDYISYSNSGKHIPSAEVSNFKYPITSPGCTLFLNNAS